MAPTTAELIDDVRRLLATDAPLDERIVAMDGYSERFALWYDSQAIESDAAEIVRAQELLNLHNQLVERAQEWLKEAGQELGKQRAKGRGIMAYTDVLPKRLSQYRPKKG